MTITPADEPGILMEVTCDDKGDIDRQSFLVEVVERQADRQEGAAEARVRPPASKREPAIPPRVRERWDRPRPEPGAHRTPGDERLRGTQMSNFVNLLIAGLATGAIYALVAIGFTLLWQTSQTINFAQGEFVMLPAFFMLAGDECRRCRSGSRILIGLARRARLLGLGFKRLLVDPMLRHGVLPLAIATMALAIFIKEAVKDFFSAEAQPFPSIMPAIDVSILGTVVSLQSIGVLVVAIVAVLALQAFLTARRPAARCRRRRRTRRVARILGIPVERMILLHVPDQRRPGRARLAAGHADLSRQVLQRRNPRTGSLHRGDRRRLQPGARRHRRRPAARHARQPRRRLHLDALPRRHPALFLIVVILFRPQGLLGRTEERTV